MENIEFNYRLISWQCSCGTPRNHVKVGVTSFGEVCAIWNCSNCGQDAMARIKIEDLIRDIPGPPEPKALPPPVLTPEDTAYLKEMHIDLEGS